MSNFKKVLLREIYRLGISNILISPIQTNPDSSFRESSPPFRKQMGFDGGWPIEPTSIDPRFGTEDDLKLVVTAAHKKDMKIFIEFIFYSAFWN